jgi:protoporphyrinogen oxidase
MGRVVSSETVSLTVMLGGTTDPEAMTLTDSQIEALLKNELHQVLGWVGESFELHITRWKNAIPIYGPHLRVALDTAAAEFAQQKPGVLLCGNWTGNVSLRGILSDTLTLNRNL